MEPQAEYRVKSQKFHGEYFSPGQGKRSDQYKLSGIIFFISCLVLLAIIFVAGIIEVAKWIIQFIHTL